MLWQRLRRLVGGLLLLTGLAMLAWGLWPQGQTQRQMALASAGDGPYNLLLSAPSALRQGDEAVLRLTLTAAGDAADATASAPALALAAARLEQVGLAVSPSGETTQPFTPGRQLVFSWRVTATQPGNYPLTVWLHRRPLDSAAGATPPLTAQRLELRASSLLGLSGAWARWLGLTALLVGLWLLLIDGGFGRWRVQPTSK